MTDFREEAFLEGPHILEDLTLRSEQTLFEHFLDLPLDSA